MTNKERENLKPETKAKKKSYYFIDNAPYDEKTFYAQLAKVMCDKDKFAILSNPYAFFTLDEKVQRDLLTAACGDVADSEVDGYDEVSVPTNFDKFAMYWFENFNKRKVADGTYKKNLDTYKRDIQKKFAKDEIDNVSPIKIQKFLDGFLDKARTMETLHSILNQIFNCSVKHGITKLNPIGMVFYQKHEREHGKAISKDDEKRLLAVYADTPFQIDFAIALYTGLRPNEYTTATIDGDFIKAKNSKRKDGKIEYKRIPITPMLRPLMSDVAELKLHHPATITEKFKQVLPNNQLYDLRTIFQTRCTECGISEIAIGLFMGNAIGGELKKAYTDVSDEYLLREGEKLNY